MNKTNLTKLNWSVLLIQVTGTPANCERAKEAILERVKDIEADRKDRELKSFTLQIEVNPDFHPKIIGKRGAVITKIRQDHDVQIVFPRKGKSVLFKTKNMFH